jgi:hypothetical protein
MNIKPAKNPAAHPRTRRELLAHLWGEGITDCDIYKEGARYTIKRGRTLAATGTRRINTFSFTEWQRKALDVPARGSEA